MAFEYFNKWAPWLTANLIKDFNLDLESALAIVGNAGHESGGFVSLQELKPLVKGSRGGYGIMQWTGPRRRDYEGYCARNNLKPSDMESNYKFLFVELKGSEGDRTLPALRAAKGLDAKVAVFSEKFLRPGIPHLDSRKVWARRAKEAWEKAPEAKEVPKVETPVVTPTKSVDPAPASKRTIWDIIIEIILIVLRGGK